LPGSLLVRGALLGYREVLEGMAVSVRDAHRTAGAGVWITLTPADVNVIACAIRSELASALDATVAHPLPGREEIATIRRILDVYERQLAELEWGEPQADIVMECPTSQLEIVASDLRDGAGKRQDSHRVAVCAMVQHLSAQARGRLEG
jgi:hypothetical protein